MTGHEIPKNWAEARRKLAIDRSNQDAEQSNDNLRAAAQAIILINGGAATAVLAFISAVLGKDKAVDPHIIGAAGYAIIFYAFGAGCGPFVIWFMNLALKHWNQSWQQVVKNPASEITGTKEHELALPWYRWANLFLLLSIVGFVAGSLTLSRGFINAPSLMAASVPTKSSAPPMPPAPPSPATPP